MAWAKCVSCKHSGTQGPNDSPPKPSPVDVWWCYTLKRWVTKEESFRCDRYRSDE